MKITALSRWTKTAAIHTNSSEQQESKSDGRNARRFLYAFSCSASAAACRDADIIAGPIGILMADALMGEITPAIAVAIGQSRAQKVLLPVNSHCGKIVVGVRELTLSRIMDEAVEVLRELCAPRSTTL